MKQKILDALKTKFPGVSENILNRIAEKLAKTVTTEEQVQTAIDGVTFQQVIDGEADRRVTEASQTAVANYEKKHGLKDGQKVEGGSVTENNDPTKKKPETDNSGELTLEAITAAITAANKPLLERIAAIETGKVSETRKQKLGAIIEKLPESLRKPYNRITLTEMTDEDFEKFLTETEKEVEGIASDVSAKGAVINPPMGGSVSKGEVSDSQADEVLKGM